MITRYHHSKCKILHSLILTITALSVQAEIILDGSLGQKMSLPGPNFTIDANLGQQRGPNLFHSFQKFGLETGESATFNGPADIHNVISRVTGGQVSSIDGTVRVTIPAAHFYFLNPAGLLLGEHAQLDTTGSVYFSTANYLRLGQEQFMTSIRGATSFTVAAPTAFGFLRDKPGIIMMNGSQLRVTPGETIAAIGGNVRINNGTLSAPAGTIRLTSVAGKSEIAINQDASAQDSKNAYRGHITLTHRAMVDVSGDHPGTIQIQGGQFLLDDQSQLLADSKNGETTQDTFIFVDAAQLITLSNSHIHTHGHIDLGESEFFILNNSSIQLGKGGNVQVMANHFFRDDRSHIDMALPVEMPTLAAVAIPEIYTHQQMTTMPTEFFSIPQFIKESCQERDNQEKSRLTAVERRGLPISSEDFQPSSLPRKGLLE